jgi:hypothetical protein
MRKPGTIRCRATTTGDRRRAGGEPALFRRPAGHGRAQGRRARRRSPGGGPRPQAAGLFPAEFPLPDRRLSHRGVGKALRHPGRGAVFRQRQRHAPPVPGAAQPVREGPRPAQPAAPRRGLRHGALFALRQAGLAAPARRRARPVRRLSGRGPGSPEALRRGLACRQRRSHAVCRRQFRRRHVDLPVPRDPARGPPHRGGRVRPHPQARRPADLHGLPAARRHGELRRAARQLPGELPRALLSDLYAGRPAGAVRRGGAGAGVGRAGVPVEARGLRQAQTIDVLGLDPSTRRGSTQSRR